MTRVAVLASGSGSNLQAILDHQSALGAAASARVVLVASDNADAGALTRAQNAGIAAQALDRNARTTGLAGILAQHHVDLVVLSGYLRLVPADVVSHYRGRILNVHPALLPAFGGRGMFGHHVHEAVIASGACLTGPSVHFVDERYDEGPVIAQAPVPVLPADTPDELAARVSRDVMLVGEAVVRRSIALHGEFRPLTIELAQLLFGPGPRALMRLVRPHVLSCEFQPRHPRRSVAANHVPLLRVVRGVYETPGRGVEVAGLHVEVRRVAKLEQQATGVGGRLDDVSQLILEVAKVIRPQFTSD